MFHLMDSWLTARNLLFILILVMFVELGRIFSVLRILEGKINSLQDTVDNLNDIDLDNSLAAAKERLEMERIEDLEIERLKTS